MALIMENLMQASRGFRDLRLSLASVSEFAYCSEVCVRSFSNSKYIFQYFESFTKCRDL